MELAGAFPAAAREDWLARVAGVLKGADFEKRLVGRSRDGLRLEPIYEKAEPAPQPWRATPGRWRVGQRVDHPDPAEANALVLADLEGGADSLVLVFRDAPAARGFGLPASSLDELDRALAGVKLDLVHHRLDAGGGGRQAAALLVALAERRGHPLAALSLDLALDPIGAMAATGRLSAPWDVVAARCAETLTALAGRGFADKAFLADGRPWHEAGAGEAQELAAVLATGLAYLRALEAGGHALDAARDAVAFLLVADADEFLSLAKFRALRRLWARVEELCGLAPKPIRLHAETAWRMATRRDPWVNMLRATVATFAAGLGGADSVTVLPFTTALGLPDGFARRVARNTQHVLLDEANLWRVADPAAGAGAFEALTKGLCERAWALFREIEGEGGIVASLQAGAVQARIAAARAARERDVATRREPITGTSAFPDLREAPVAVLMQAAAVPESAPEPAQPPAGSFRDLVAVAHSRSLPAPAAGAAVAEPLPSHRAAEPFERLRDASDAILAATGARPRVFLATLGPVAAFTARATFARALFEAGGIETVGGEAYDSLDAMAAAFRASGTLRACLCSSDALYAAQAPEAARRLKEAGCRTLFLAGRAAEAEAELRQAGVDAFVFTGADVLSLLHSAYAEEEGGPSPVSP